MRILNVRLGLATNSSSTHSIVFLPQGVRARERKPVNGPSCYGWDYFQLRRSASKLDYLATSLYQQLRQDVGDDIAETVARDWCGVPVVREGYVDHQSEIAFPRDWNGRGLDRDFVNDFKEFILRDDIVIVGGNDNDERKPEVVRRGGIADAVRLPVEQLGAIWVARKDGECWTLFNRENGCKIRLTFQGSEFSGVPARSSAPELVDVKITDYCPFDCGYCYQDSTREGEHAEIGWLDGVAYQLGKMRVFEVAIGGGEPTLHPEFPEILRGFRRNGIVPNFTTKSLGWLRDSTQREEILAHTGAFAYSVERASDVEALQSLIKDQDDVRATVQHVVGVADEDEFRRILLACAREGTPITLLGYKEVGRGPSFGRRPSSRWLDILADVCREHWLRVGIDTALADRHWDDILAKGVSEHLMTRTEGQFSCYIDAVAKTMNTSSYNDRPGVSIGNPYRTDLGQLYRDLPHEGA